MNPNIFDAVSPRALATFITEANDPLKPAAFGESLFPTSYVPGMSMSYIKDKTRLHVALRPSALDAEPTIRGRKGFQRVTEELPFFREAFFVGEKDYKLLMSVYNGDMSADYAAQIRDQFLDDGYELYSGALMQLEAMRMQLLSKGGVIELSDGAIKYDFEMPDENRFVVSPGSEWNNTAASDPIADIRKWRKDMLSGPGRTSPTIVVMSETTWGYIMDNEKINQSYWAERGISIASGTGPTISSDEYMDYLRRKLNTGVYDTSPVSFKIIGGTYRPHENSDAMPLFEDNCVALLPLENLGKTYYTDTPESDFNASGLNTGKFTVETMDSGITVSQSIPDKPPLSLETWVSMIAMPSFQSVDKCGLAIVS
jgi:hypothetical protein